MLQFLWKAVLV